MSPKAITTIHWAKISGEHVPFAVDLTENYALWVSPVDSDECFNKAGFNDFKDSTKEWDKEFNDICGCLLKLMEQIGGAVITKGEEPVRIESWWQRLFRHSPIKDRISIKERILLTARDDSFGDLIVDFGSPRKASLYVSSGHPFFILSFASKTAQEMKEFFISLAQGRPLMSTQLKWSYLIGGPPH
jgi:hypothetical protein